MPRVTSLTKGKMPAVYPDVRTGRPELFPPGVLGDEELEIERDYTAAKRTQDRRVSFLEFFCEAELHLGVSLSRGRETTCLAESYLGGRGQWEQTLSIRRDESLDPQNLGIRGPHIAQCQALISEGLT